MAVTIVEMVTSQALHSTPEGTDFTRIFNIYGTRDPFIANAYGPKIGSYYRRGLVANDRKLIPLMVTINDADCVWELTVTYAPMGAGTGKGENATKPTDQSEEQFNTLTQMEHIVRAINAYHFPTTEDVGILIGVHGDVIEGVDVFAPQCNYSEKVEMPALPLAQKQMLIDLTGKTNGSQFRGWNTGDVLFMGVSGTHRENQPWFLQFNFGIIPTKRYVIQTLDGSNHNIVKPGWDYIWFNEVQAANVARTLLVTRLLSVHVNQVYEAADFRNLGIGALPK